MIEKLQNFWFLIVNDSKKIYKDPNLYPILFFALFVTSWDFFDGFLSDQFFVRMNCDFIFQNRYKWIFTNLWLVIYPFVVLMGSLLLILIFLACKKINNKKSAWSEVIIITFGFIVFTEFYALILVFDYVQNFFPS